MATKTTSTSRADPWKPTQNALRGIIGDAESMYADGGFNINPYGGDWVAGQNADTTGGQAGLRSLLPGMTGRATGAANYVSSMAGPQNYDQIKANTIADIMPSINASFAGSGMAGSSLHQQNLAKGLAAGLGNVELGARDQSLRAAGMMPGMNAAEMQPAMAQMAMGADQQGYDQSVTDAAMQRDMMVQTQDMSALQQYAQLMSGIGGQFGRTSGTQSQPLGIGGILGLGLQAAPLFMGSDSRIKRDVKRVGTADNGLPIYTFRYNGAGDAVHMGIMAQEALDVCPDAVAEIGGVLAVDYGRAF